MLFDALSILLTDRCNASCDICCLNCSPRGKRTLAPEKVRKAIRQAGETEGMEEIRFTGGEPFLYGEKLADCAAWAKENGLRSVVHTNGFWGADPQKAAARTKELKKAGVYKIHFSADPYHQKYVPFSALETAMRCTREAGILTEISIMEINGSHHCKQVREAMPEEYEACISVSRYPLLPVGRAAAYVKEEQVIKRVLPMSAKCIFSGMASLFVDGWYHLCCSMYCDSIPRLRLGHMDEVSFSDLESIVLSDDCLYVMLKEGFGWYMQRLGEFGAEIPERVCFPCACCQMVFSNQAFLEKIADEVHERAERLRREQTNNR